MSRSAPTGVLTAEAFDTPRILLAGAVDYAMYDRFRDQLAGAQDRADGDRTVDPGGAIPRWRA